MAKKKKTKPGFMLYHDTLAAVLDILTYEQAGRLLKADYLFSAYGEEPAFDNEPVLLLAWRHHRESLVRDNERYQNISFERARASKISYLKNNGIVARNANDLEIDAALSRLMQDEDGHFHYLEAEADSANAHTCAPTTTTTTASSTSTSAKADAKTTSQAIPANNAIGTVSYDYAARCDGASEKNLSLQSEYARVKEAFFVAYLNHTGNAHRSVGNTSEAKCRSSLESNGVYELDEQSLEELIQLYLAKEYPRSITKDFSHFCTVGILENLLLQWQEGRTA